ncbi:MAG TPA: right-handed parallel beta-helix repeat-containing protein [Solirubrobacterales bacterium]|jgi:hypothetical protein|nr:right-handed parallel beta-helix repeat-containing protein [Solirubrobacterales bacterium]
MSRLARYLTVAALALGGVGVVTSAAAARDAQGHHFDGHGPHTYAVTTLDATGPGSLAEAIERANTDDCQGDEPDHIVFDVAGEIDPDGTLPAITAAVDLDATSAPGYAPGAPVVELVGGGTPGAGLTVRWGGAGSEIVGLAIGGFERGVVIVGDRTTLAASRISGNEGDGVVVVGSHDHLAGNLIGTDAAGTGPLPNGGAGVRIGAEAVATLIGGVGADGPGNTIAFNLGPGVEVEAGAAETTISSNSIFANGGRGIEVPTGGSAPAGPVLTGFSASSTGTTVEGIFTGEPEAAYELEFFANEGCAPNGQGQTFLGASTVTTDATGQVAFKTVALAPLPAGATFLSATATGGAGRSTSEFSGCLGEPELVVPEELPVSPLPSALPAPVPAASAPSAILPINGATITIEPKTGRVRVKTPGTGRFRSLTELESVPIGSLVDTTEGKARIASASATEEVQSAAFFGGVFRVLQPEGRTLTTMRLFDNESESCTAPSPDGATASASTATNHLWGSGKGSFRTEGNFGSATVRGTIWFVADRCRSTFFRVNRGVVTVRDFPHARSFSLRAGATYTVTP